VRKLPVAGGGFKANGVGVHALACQPQCDKLKLELQPGAAKQLRGGYFAAPEVF